MVDRAIDVVGLDRDMAMGAAARLLHDLELLLADEDRGVARLDRHIQQRAEGFGRLGGFGLIGRIDADMAELEAEHCIDGFLAHRGDLVPGAGLDLVRLAHPGAADRKDLVIGQVIVDVLGVDAAGAHPLGGLERAADVLEHRNAAVGLCREELDRLAAKVHRLLHLTGRAGAGHHDAALFDDMLGDVGVEARADNEGCAGRHCAVRLVDGQHGAGAQQHFRHFLMDFLDAIFGAGRAEGHFRGRQAAGHQRLAQGHSLVHAVESNDRDDADLIHALYNRIHSTFSLLHRFAAALGAALNAKLAGSFRGSEQHSAIC